MTRDDGEILESGRESSSTPRPWRRRAGWFAAGLLVLGVALVEERPDLRTDASPPAPAQSSAPETESPRRAPAPVTVLPDTGVPHFWLVEGTRSEVASAPLLRSNGRTASVHVQCIGPGTVRVTAGTGRFVEVTCPDDGYASRTFDVAGSFLRGTDTTLADPVAFEVVATEMAAGSQWRVWTVLPFTII